MKRSNWFVVAKVSMVVLLSIEGSAVHAATAPSLGTAQSFAVLGATSVSNTGTSVITGDLGIAPGLASSVMGFPPGIVTGGAVLAGAVIPDPTAAQAQLDAGVAFTALDQPCNTTFTAPTDLGGLTLTPGVYCFGSTAALTGTLTLNGGGNPNAVWIFKVGSALTTATDSVVQLINGAQNCNVFWRVVSSAVLQTRTTFVGTLIANTSVTLVTNASISGRAVALTADVTLDTNNILATPVCASVPALAPTLGKAFDAAVVNAGDVSTLTITLSNPNLSAASLTAPLTDTLPAGVVIAATPNASTTCGGGSTVTATAGGTTVTLPAGRSIPAGGGAGAGTCTVTVDVTAAAAGSYIDTMVVGALQTSLGSNVTPAVATLTVAPTIPPGGPPTLGKTFGPATITVGGISTLTITLSNPSLVAATLSSQLTDALPAGIVVAATPNASTTCGGGSTVTATAGGTTVTLLPGRSIPAGVGSVAGTCTVTVDVTAGTAGAFINVLPADVLVTTNGNNASPIVTTLTVGPRILVPPPVPVPALSGGATILLMGLLTLVAFAAMHRLNRSLRPPSR